MPVDICAGPFTGDVGAGIFVADVGAGVSPADIGAGVFVGEVGAGGFVAGVGTGVGTLLVLERVMRVEPAADAFGRLDMVIERRFDSGVGRPIETQGGVESGDEVDDSGMLAKSLGFRDDLVSLLRFRTVSTLTRGCIW